MCIICVQVYSGIECNFSQILVNLETSSISRNPPKDEYDIATSDSKKKKEDTTNQNSMHIFGSITKKLVVTPDFDIGDSSATIQKQMKKLRSLMYVYVTCTVCSLLK